MPRPITMRLPRTATTNGPWPEFWITSSSAPGNRPSAAIRPRSWRPPSIDFSTARQFTRHFYRRLLTHGLVDLATNEARANP